MLIFVYMVPLSLLAAAWLSVTNRRNRWVWFAWMPAVVIPLCAVVWVIWLAGSAFSAPRGQPGGGGEFVALVRLVVVLTIGGAILVLLLRYHPVVRAHDAPLVVGAFLSWALVIAGIIAALYLRHRVTLQFVVSDESGKLVDGAAVTWRGSTDLGAPLLPRLKSDRYASTDSKGIAEFSIVAFDHASATVRARSAATIQVVSLYLRAAKDAQYHVTIHDWENMNGEFGNELRRRELTLPRQRRVVIPVTVTGRRPK